jgi:hypothetical protein
MLEGGFMPDELSSIRFKIKELTRERSRLWIQQNILLDQYAELRAHFKKGDKVTYNKPHLEGIKGEIMSVHADEEFGVYYFVRILNDDFSRKEIIEDTLTLFDIVYENGSIKSALTGE